MASAERPLSYYDKIFECTFKESDIVQAEVDEFKENGEAGTGKYESEVGSGKLRLMAMAEKLEIMVGWYVYYSDLEEWLAHRRSNRRGKR